MDAKTFIDTYGRDEAERVAKAAGTNREYFNQLASGSRNPSLKLAEKLVAASEGRLDLMALLRSTPDRKAPDAGPMARAVDRAVEDTVDRAIAKTGDAFNETIAKIQAG